MAADGTHIEWTEATWNPITGCMVKSPGCTHCYAMQLAGTRLKHHPSRAGLTTETKTGGHVWNGEVRLNEQWIDQPARWRRPRDIFVCAHADLFYERVPREWQVRIIEVMLANSRHRFQVLTKRPEVALDLLNEYAAADHILIGASVERQQEADERRSYLERIAARGWRTWVSYEPALDMVDWTGWEFIHWMVSGGESDVRGRARPSHPGWHRAARDWSKAWMVPYFFKQHGDWAPNSAATVSHVWGDGSGVISGHVGKKAAGSLLDGREHKEMPR